MTSGEDMDSRANSSTSTTLNVPRNPTAKPETTTTSLLGKPSKAHRGLENWPTVPKPVKKSTYGSIWSVIVDITLFAFSTAFFAFALFVNSYNQASTAENPLAKERLLRAAKYGPTMFPILFAAVIGRAAHAVLVWRLERGERLGILDTLASSTSFTSTISSQFRLRVFTACGFFLVIIWGLSPVGGQASIRQISIGTMTTTQPEIFDYMIPKDNLVGFQSSGELVAATNALFLTTVISPPATKKSPLDIWGNVKIPRIEHYEGSIEHSSDREGWFDTNIGDEQHPDIFASLTGVPISGLQGTRSTGFEMKMHTMYLNLTCSMFDGKRPKMTSMDNETGMLWVYSTPTDVAYVTSEGVRSAYFSWKDHDTIPGEKNVYNTSYRSDIAARNGSLEAFRFVYAQQSDYQHWLECAFQTTYVEVEVSCLGSDSCLASRIRRSKLGHPSSNLTQLDIATNGQWNWLQFASQLLAARPLVIDHYVATPDKPILTPNWDLSGTSQSTESDSAPGNLWAVRLGQIMNAYWTCMTGTYTLSGGVTNQTTFLDPHVVHRLTANYNGTMIYYLPDITRVWRTEGTKSTTSEVIQAHKGWVAALSIASVLLIIASLIPPLVRHFLTKGPGIEINLSSLATRNNPYIPLPAGGTFIDASHRARMLKNHKVRFGDVDVGGNVGSLAIGVLDEKRGLDVVRVRKGRVYE